MNKIMAIVFSCVIYGLCAGCKSKVGDVAHEKYRASFLHDCFPTNREAIVLGNEIIASLVAGKKMPEKICWGEKVAFYGSGPAIGGNANLVLDSNILLLVDIQPPASVAPTAAVWEACVLGKFISVDLDKKIISITATPDDWYCGETM